MLIGIDLFNEPWDYTWGHWRTNVEDAYQAINAVNPNILIFAEGVSDTANNQDGTPELITQEPHGNTTANWGRCTAGWYGHAYDPITNTAGWGEWRPFDQRKTNLLNKLWRANAPAS